MSPAQGFKAFFPSGQGIELIKGPATHGGIRLFFFPDV